MSTSGTTIPCALVHSTCSPYISICYCTTKVALQVTELVLTVLGTRSNLGIDPAKSSSIELGLLHAHLHLRMLSSDTSCFHYILPSDERESKSYHLERNILLIQKPQLTFILHHRLHHQTRFLLRSTRVGTRPGKRQSAYAPAWDICVTSLGTRTIVPWYINLPSAQAEGCAMSALAMPVQPTRNHYNGLSAQPMENFQGSPDQKGGQNVSISQSSPRKRASSGGGDMKIETLTKRESSTPNENSCEGKDSSQNDDKKPKKRRKVNHACVYCRRSHMTCDQARPCSRCKKRDIGHLCHDEPRELKKMKSEADGEGEEEEDGFSPLQHYPARSSLSGHRPQLSSEGQMEPQIDPTNAPFAQQIGQDPSRMHASNGKLSASQPFRSTHQCSSNDSISI